MINIFKKTKLNKILIIRFGAIGDVVHSTALIRSLKKINPDLDIHYLTFKTPSLLIENDPDINKVWVLDSKNYNYLFEFSKNLRKEKYDVCINLQPSIRTKVFNFLIGARFNLIYKKTFKLHAVENFWRTVKPLFKDIILDNNLKLYIPESSREKISEFFNPEKKHVVFNMGVSPTRQGRRWPVEYWRNLAKIILDKYNCQIVLTGSNEDISLAEELLDISGDIKSFCGKLSILENAALLSKCDLVISCDTGPLHIATAVETPTIGLYGAAPISRTGPYGELGIAINSCRDCVPCNKRKCKYITRNDLYTPCLEDITPERVMEVIETNSVLE